MAVKSKTPDSEARNTVASPELPADTPLPLVGVARALVGTEIARLRSVAVALERETANSGTGPSGLIVPYLVQRDRELRERLEKVRQEIEALEEMDEHSVRVWAYDKGYR